MHFCLGVIIVLIYNNGEPMFVNGITISCLLVPVHFSFVLYHSHLLHDLSPFHILYQNNWPRLAA